MRNEHMLLSAVHFLVSTALLLVGLVCVFSPMFPDVRYTVISFLEAQESTLLVGLGLIATAFLFFWCFFRLYRTQFYQMLFSPRSLQITVEKPLLHQFVDSYWHAKFPKEVLIRDLWFRPDGQWEFLIQFRIEDLDRQKEILEVTEKELSELFYQKFGYKSAFILNVTTF